MLYVVLPVGTYFVLESTSGVSLIILQSLWVYKYNRQDVCKMNGHSNELLSCLSDQALIDICLSTQTSVEFPFQKVPQGYKSTISMATIVGSRTLTNPGSVKTTLELDISLQV